MAFVNLGLFFGRAVDWSRLGEAGIVRWVSCAETGEAVGGGVGSAGRPEVALESTALAFPFPIALNGVVDGGGMVLVDDAAATFRDEDDDACPGADLSFKRLGGKTGVDPDCPAGD